jgi:hypothetical protein
MLKELGLRYQLGHVGGQACVFLEQGHTDFVVIANNGIHTIDVDFCSCPGRPDPFIQLLEMRWWPSTPTAPQTAATMDVLRSFHVLNLEAQVPATDFYPSLERKTDSQGLRTIPVRFFSASRPHALGLRVATHQDDQAHRMWA